MGLLYTDGVLSCRMYLESNATNMFASEKYLYGEDGMLVGVVIIERILSNLGSLPVWHEHPSQAILKRTEPLEEG